MRMTSLLTAPARESYDLSQALQEPTRSPTVRETRPEEVEFSSRGVDFYREAGEEESFVGFDQIPVLAKQLSVG